MYLLKRDYDRAIDYFRELDERFPNGSRASYAHWKAAWLTFRQGRVDEARKAFEDQIALYPDSGEVPAALYWRGRLAEEEGGGGPGWPGADDGDLLAGPNSGRLGYDPALFPAAIRDGGRRTKARHRGRVQPSRR